MRGGESELAISPYCGTNLVVGGLLAALLSGLVMSRTKSTAGRVTLGMAAALAAGAIGRPLGKIVQRRYTTLSEVDGVEIAGSGGSPPENGACTTCALFDTARDRGLLTALSPRCYT